MEDVLIEAFDLIPEVTRAVMTGLKNARVNDSLIKGVECLLRLQQSASMSYSARTVNPGTLAGIVKECRALLVELEGLSREVVE